MPVPDSEDALLADCTVARMKVIAKAMQLTGFARLLKVDLEALISNAMLSITECPTCGGGQCDPLSHYFAPATDNTNSAISSPDRHALAALGDGTVHDEFHDDNAISPFVNGQVTEPGAVPDLANNIRQGGLDLAAAAARDRESQSVQVDPIQARIDEALAAEAVTLAQERLAAAAARDQELQALQEQRNADAAAEAEFQTKLAEQRQLLHDEHQRLLTSEANITEARRAAINMPGPSSRPNPPIIRAQPPTPVRRPRPPAPAAAAVSGPRMIPPRPPSQVHRLPAPTYHPDVLDASQAPRSAPAAGGEFNFAHLERIMTTAFTAAIHANKPPATAFPPNM